MLQDMVVVVRGGGELGSAAARLLFRCGVPVAVLERPEPLAVRRLVSFAEAVRAGETQVEGVPGRRVDPGEARAWLDRHACVPVLVDPEARCLARIRPQAVVDARMAKRNLGTTRADAPLVVGLGPGFTAGADVHAVVETRRGPSLGRLIWSGPAAADTAVPGEVGGVSGDRVLRAPVAGAFRSAAQIGQRVAAGDVVGWVADQPVSSRIPGMVRGLLSDGVAVGAGEKLGDVDPRSADVDPARVSDKGRAVAAGVLEAVLTWQAQGS